MPSTIVSNEAARGGRRVVFTHEVGGRTYGPFVEQRPADDDLDAFLAGQLAALESSLGAAMRLISSLEFRDRFTDAEQDAIYALIEAGGPVGRQVARWKDDAAAGGTVNLDSERVTAGLTGLTQLLPEVFTAERVAELLA